MLELMLRLGLELRLRLRRWRGGLYLSLWQATDAKFIQNVRKLWVGKEHASEVSETGILFHQSLVLQAQLVILAGFSSNFAFELSNVF